MEDTQTIPRQKAKKRCTLGILMLPELKARLIAQANRPDVDLKMGVLAMQLIRDGVERMEREQQTEGSAT